MLPKYSYSSSLCRSLLKSIPKILAVPIRPPPVQKKELVRKVGGTGIP